MATRVKQTDKKLGRGGRVKTAAVSKSGRGSSSRGKADRAQRALISAVSLDDAAVLLMQLDPTDWTGFERLRQLLNDIGASDRLSVQARNLVAGAAQKVDCFLEGETSDGQVLITEVGKLLESALEVVVEPAVASTTEMQDESTPEIGSAACAISSTSCLPAAAEVSAQPNVPELLPPDSDLELLGEFINESRECIESAEAALLLLETDPENTEAVNTVFRAFHTLKGTTAFLGLKRMSELAHRAENLLSRVRDNEIRCAGGYADLALRSVDMLKDLLQSVQNAIGGQPMTRPNGYDDLNTLLADPEAAGISEEYEESSCPLPRLGDILVADGKIERKDLEAVLKDKGDQPLGVALLQSQTATLTDIAAALRKQRRMARGEQRIDSSVRVSTERLDGLIDMVGELVIAQSMVVQDEVVNHGGHYELLKKVTHSGKIVRELQDLSMSMRMVPLKATFQKMSRLVRDLAHKSGKNVNLVTDDGDTEIDRNMVDVINDLLVHMVRNSVDHGIEPPDMREKNGKDRSGTVMLSAFHSGGSVVVEIRDDGKGLDRNKIVEKAIARGLIESDKGLSDSEVYNLIFAPGFSTADHITDISGRGVGMDVVKEGVETLRGRIDISSEAGRGCTFSVRLPLTLAITDGMLVQVGPERYIIPTVNIHLSFRPSANALSTIAGRGEMVMLRGDLMPVFRLHRLFKVEGSIEDPTKALLVVVGDGEHRCALLVDELLGQQQVVAKSLGDGLGKVHGVFGGAILGDGRVGLILDPAEVAALARQVPSAGERQKVPSTSAA